jgi:sterol desaturase/sphingolipid hydroxylase (fatty acid hydroxylase superfamily)
MIHDENDISRPVTRKRGWLTITMHGVGFIGCVGTSALALLAAMPSNGMVSVGLLAVAVVGFAVVFAFSR